MLTHSIQITVPWHLRTPIIYRYLPEKFVNEFFESGNLRLSSFRQFGKHADEERGDTKEGWNVLVGTSQTKQIYAVTGHGFDAYVLCGTSVLNAELMARFGCDSAIRINDTTGFGMAVANHLSGLRQAFEGPCYYSNGTIDVKVDDSQFESLQAALPEHKLDLSKLGGFLLNMAGSAVYFKKLLKYEHQSEYRLVWIVQQEVDGYLEIECPEARQFCEKL